MNERSIYELFVDSFPRDPFSLYCRWALVHAAPHGRRDEYNPVTSDEEHGDVPLGRPVHLLVGLLVDLD